MNLEVKMKELSILLDNEGKVILSDEALIAIEASATQFAGGDNPPPPPTHNKTCNGTLNNSCVNEISCGPTNGGCNNWNTCTNEDEIT